MAVAHPDRKIDIGPAEIDEARRGVDSQRKLGMPGVETAEARHQPAGGEGRRNRGDQRMGGAVVGQGDGARQFPKSGGQPRGEEVAEFRRGEPLARSLKQSAADLFFGAANLLAHRAR